MGVITKLLFRGEILKEAPHRNLFLDMEENIHIHYRDLRIEMSRGEFEEFVNTFSLQSKELMQIIIDRNYHDGKLANANQEDTRIWTESRLNTKVKYHPCRISLEECTDGYHIHLRNSKFLLDKEDFIEFLKAARAVDIDQPYASTIKEINQLLEDNHIDFVVSQYSSDNACTLLAADYHESKIRTVLLSIGLERTINNGVSSFSNSKGLTFLVNVTNREEIMRLKNMRREEVTTSLTSHLINKRSIDPDWLNRVQCQVLDMFSYVKKCEKTPDVDLDYTKWTYNVLEDLVVFPFKIASRNLSKAEIKTLYRDWNQFLKNHDMFFIKPSKVVFERELQEETNKKIMDEIMKEANAFEAISKIYLMGSTAKKNMGLYNSPFIHSEWAKLGSDVDILIELNEDAAYKVPQHWDYINISATNQCAIYHIGEIPLNDKFGFQRLYPNIRFFHHLIDAYVYVPSKGDEAKKNAFLDKFKAELIFSRERQPASQEEPDTKKKKPADGKQEAEEEKIAATIDAIIQKEYGVLPYGLGRLKVSTENDIFHFSIKGQNFILKCYKVSGNYNSERLAEHARYEAAFVCELAKRGVSTSKLFKTKKGEMLIEVDGYAAILYSYVEGRIFKYPDPEFPIAESVQILSKLHKSQMEKAFDIEANFSFEDVFNIWHKEYDRFAKEVADDPELSDAFAKLRGIYKGMVKGFRHVNTLKGVPWLHNHGDVTPRNFVIHDGKASLIDFQNAFYGPRLLDVIDGAYEFSFGGKPPGKDDFARFDLFVNAYSAEAPFTKAEQNCLDDVIKIHGIIKYIKEVRMIKGDKSSKNQRRLRALSVADFLKHRFL